MLLDVNEIQKILPHRYPFLLIDGIEEMERWKRIVGIKNVTINESYFQGHFPGKPIMPGVLIIESMAQTGGLLLLKEVADREKKLLYFVSIDNARLYLRVERQNRTLKTLTRLSQEFSSILRLEELLAKIMAQQAQLITIGKMTQADLDRLGKTLPESVVDAMDERRVLPS